MIVLRLLLFAATESDVFLELVEFLLDAVEEAHSETFDGDQCQLAALPQEVLMRE